VRILARIQHHMHLSSAESLPARNGITGVRGLQLPAYPRSSLVPSVVHIGLGGFHRSHQAVYFDDLANATGSRWGIVAASVRSRHVVDALVRQHGLYTMLDRGSHGESARIIGSLVDCLFGPDDPSRLLAVLTDPRTRLVTLTITGDGYATYGPRPDPRLWTVWDYLVEALARRRRSAIQPFTVLSCDNIPANGQSARRALLAAARRRDEVLARWIERTVACPESMVDRITPAAGAEQEDYVQSAYGVKDRCSVVTEPFSQWVIAEDFCNDKPPLEAVGVQFVSDVKPYSVMKRRLLNAGHSALGYLGALAGYRWTDEALGDLAIRGYLQALMRDEIAPLLPRVPGIDLPAYQRGLIERFSNRALRDRLERLCGRGSTKMPAYLLPSASEASQRGSHRDLLAVAVAAWMRYLRGTDLSGSPMALKDARLAELQPLALQGGCDPRPLLAKRDIFGDLIEDDVFVTALERSLAALDRGGVGGLLASYVPNATSDAA
jgi:mannitol 2-dehydrogenase